MLSSLFFRNKGAYIVGKIINGFNETPFALPILHGSDGGLVIDAALFGEDDLELVFSFARAYFMVDDGGAVGVRPVPALADAEKAALRALQRARPAEAGQEPVLPRPADAHAPLVGQVPHRARASRAW